MREEGAPTKTACADTRTTGQIGERAARACRQKRIARILALEHGGKLNAGLQYGRQVFQTMHGNIDFIHQQRAIDLLREESTPAYRPERHIGAQVAFRLDMHQLNRWAPRLSTDQFRNTACLPE